MRQGSLRFRLLITFGLGALILSALFATSTYEGVHHELVNDLQHTDLHESFENAELVRTTLYTSPPNLASILNSIQHATDSSVLVNTHRPVALPKRGRVHQRRPHRDPRARDQGRGHRADIEYQRQDHVRGGHTHPGCRDASSSRSSP